MYNSFNHFYFLAITTVLLIPYSCSNQKGIENIITQAEGIVEQQPDSALRLLNTVLFPEELNKNLFNKIVQGQNTLDCNKFYPDLNFFHNGFLDLTKEKFPQWDETKFRIFCLSCGCMFNDTEVAIFLEEKISMIRKIRNKIREDMGISKYSRDFLEEYKNK